MIYSKLSQTFKPVSVHKKTYAISDFGTFTKYTVHDGRIMIGYVDLKDTEKGVVVEMIHNNHPELYSGLGKIADQIEVEHCLDRGLNIFTVESEAALNSHAVHYLRGKRFSEITDLKKKSQLIERFGTANANKIVENIIKTTKKGKEFVTTFFGRIPMYMPKDMIQVILENIKKNPLLK